MTTRLPISGRRLAQAVIWVLAAVVLAVSLWSTSTGQPDPAPVADPTVLAAGEEGDSRGYQNSNGLSSAEAQKFNDDPSHWLPAYRWMWAFNLESEPMDGGIRTFLTSMGNQILDMISSLIFSAGSLVWVILLWLVQTAFTADVVSKMGTKIDETAASVAEALGTGGVIAAVIFMLVISVGAQVARKGLTSASMRNVVMFLVAAAGLQLLSTTVPGENKLLSPTGFAAAGTHHLDNIATGLAGPLIGTVRSPSTKYADEDVPNCEYYIQRLHSTYENVVSDSEQKSRAALRMVSYLWESTALRGYTAAQYGDYDEGRYAICHQMENEQRIPYDEQAAVAGGKNTPYAGMTLEGEANVFRTYGDAKHAAAGRLIWMACRNAGRDDRAGSAWSEALDEDRFDHDDCKTWWTGSEGKDECDVEECPTRDEDFLTFGTDDDESPAAKLGGTDTTAFHVVDSYMGNNGGQRFFGATMSVLVALAYLFVFGAMSAGAIVAGTLLAVLLMLSPVTLALLAIPGKDGNRNKTGMRMLRMTGTTMAAKSMFYVALLFTTWLTTILMNLGGTG